MATARYVNIKGYQIKVPAGAKGARAVKAMRSFARSDKGATPRQIAARGLNAGARSGSGIGN